MKAVIAVGEKQYLVTEGDELAVDLITDKTILQPLLIIDEAKTLVGNPIVKNASVAFKIIAEREKADKVIAIRYKAKKRVNKIRGHRQLKTRIKITSIKIS